MSNTPFLLAAAANQWVTIVILVVIIVAFYFLLIRPQKKQEKEANEMRNNLMVGDEVTTIGGIVGKIVSLREETVVIETTKDKTHIRFLRAAIRSVDVRAEDSVNPEKKAAEQTQGGKNKKKGKKAPIEPAADKTAPVESSVDAPAEETAPIKEEAPAVEPAPEAEAAPESQAAPVAEAPVAEADSSEDEHKNA